MAWGFRKSVSFGGVRFTFSKSGVTTSVGGRGVRLTSGPRGVYVTVGAGGFYYRQRLDPPPRRSPRGPQTPIPPAGADPRFYKVETFASAEVDQLTGLSQDDFVAALNETITAGFLGTLAFLLVALLWVSVLVTVQPGAVRMLELAA